MKSSIKKVLCCCLAVLLSFAIFSQNSIAATDDKSTAPPSWVEFPPEMISEVPSYVNINYIWMVCKDYFGNPIEGIPFTAWWSATGKLFFGNGSTGAGTGVPNSDAITTFYSDENGIVFLPYYQTMRVEIDKQWVAENASKYVFGMSPLGGFFNPDRGDYDNDGNWAPYYQWNLSVRDGKLMIEWGGGMTQWFQFYGGLNPFAVPEDPGKGKIDGTPDLVLEKKVVKVGNDPTTEAIPTVKVGQTVTYKFTINNIGTYKGALHELVDVIPENFSFNKALNPGWKEVEKGKLVYTYNDYVYPSAIDNKTGVDIPAVPVVIYLMLTLESATPNNNGLIRNIANIDDWDEDEADILVPKTGSLRVSKVLAGDNTDQYKDFTFIVTFSDNGTYDGVTSGNSFTLKGSQSKTITGIPQGVQYVVKEADANTGGYTTTSTGASGTISAMQSEAIFTNTKNSPKGSLSVSKVLSGDNVDQNKAFTFIVTFSDNGTYDGVTSGSSFTLKGGQSKIITGIPQGVLYVVTETEANTDGYTTTSTGASGTISATQSEAVFTNSRNSTSPPTTSPENPITPPPTVPPTTPPTTVPPTTPPPAVIPSIPQSPNLPTVITPQVVVPDARTPLSELPDIPDRTDSGVPAEETLIIDDEAPLADAPALTKIPQTGMPLWIIPVLVITGLVLVTLGRQTTRKRRRSGE